MWLSWGTRDVGKCHLRVCLYNIVDDVAYNILWITIDTMYSASTEYVIQISTQFNIPINRNHSVWWVLSSKWLISKSEMSNEITVLGLGLLCNGIPEYQTHGQMQYGNIIICVVLNLFLGNIKIHLLFQPFHHNGMWRAGARLYYIAPWLLMFWI